MSTHQDSEKVKQAILYYPTISVPSNRWLRQAILYWDEIGSIVPQRYDETELIPYTPDIQYLKDEGEFRPFRTDLITRRGREIVQNLESELVDTILSDEFQSLLPPHSQRRITARIHKDKVSREVFAFLNDAGLANERKDDWDWYYFERRTALLYMAILAKYLAYEDKKASTVSGTNLRLYQHLNFHAKSNSNSFHGLSAKFLNILPVPREDNSLSDILDFKRKRRTELLHFRQSLTEVQRTLGSCTSTSEVNSTLAEFDGKLERGLKNLEAVLKDSKMATVAGSFEALVKVSSPGWIATALVASGAARNIADVPISWTLRGTLIAGAIGVGKYLIDERNKRRATRRDSPFSYLFRASQEGIL
jgi:hypothetical protein